MKTEVGLIAKNLVGSRAIIHGLGERGDIEKSTRAKQKDPAVLTLRGPFVLIPAITYFRTGGHYHRPWKLNCRVRNGNECGLPGMVTGNSQVRQSLAEPHSLVGIKFGSSRVACKLLGCVTRLELF